MPHVLPVRHNFAASLAVARTRKALKCSAFQGKGMPSQVRLRLTMSIEYRLRPIARARSAGRFSARPAHLFAYDGVECPAKSFKADGDASTMVK
jgi:hypothetical protein